MVMVAAIAMAMVVLPWPGAPARMCSLPSASQWRHNHAIGCALGGRLRQRLKTSASACLSCASSYCIDSIQVQQRAHRAGSNVGIQLGHHAVVVVGVHANTSMIRVMRLDAASTRALSASLGTMPLAMRLASMATSVTSKAMACRAARGERGVGLC